LVAFSGGKTVRTGLVAAITASGFNLSEWPNHSDRIPPQAVAGRATVASALCGRGWRPFRRALLASQANKRRQTAPRVGAKVSAQDEPARFQRNGSGSWFTVLALLRVVAQFRRASTGLFASWLGTDCMLNRAACVRAPDLSSRLDVGRLFPLGPIFTSNVTFWFSYNERNSVDWISEKCANRSSLPSAGMMNPYPFASLNHLTTPAAIVASTVFRLMKAQSSHPGAEKDIAGSF
jgi:hypothetical protein